MITDTHVCPESVTRSTAIQRFLYGNAGFSKLTSVEGLNTHRWRFDV